MKSPILSCPVVSVCSLVVKIISTLASWQGLGQLNFSMSENFLPKHTRFGVVIPHFGRISGKFEISSTYICPVGNVQLSILKLQLPAPTFF